MANDERNFRSTYYEKVGFKNVEEKKSIEMLLKDKIDVDRLKQFCIRYCVPSIYRSLVWEILLDILSGNKASHDFVLEQKRQEYNDLHHCATVIRMINEKTPKPQVFLAIWMIYKKAARFGVMREKENAYTAIVEALIEMDYFSDDKDIFWVATSFYERTSKYVEQVPKLIEFAQKLLEKEDPELYNQLVKINAMESLPLSRWYERCFAGLLNENSLAKIWDKLIGGASCKLLAFVAVALLVNLKHRLIRSKTVSDVLESFENLPEETADLIVNYAIQMWHEHGVVH